MHLWIVANRSGGNTLQATRQTHLRRLRSRIACGSDPPEPATSQTFQSDRRSCTFSYQTSKKLYSTKGCSCRRSPRTPTNRCVLSVRCRAWTTNGEAEDVEAMDVAAAETDAVNLYSTLQPGSGCKRPAAKQPTRTAPKRETRSVLCGTPGLPVPRCTRAAGELAS